MKMMQYRKPIKSPPPPTLPNPTNNPKQFQDFKFIFISMAALLSFALISLLLFSSISSASRHHHNDKPTADTPPSVNIIHDACKASRDPPTCESSLTQSNRVPSNAAVSQVIQSSLWVSSQNLNTGRAMVNRILDASAANPTRSNAAKTCLELLRYSDYRTNLSVDDALSRGRIKDARAWTSAALVYQYDCWSALKYVNDTSLVGETMSFFHSTLIPSTSDALGMMVNYDVLGERTGSWGPPKTERDGFWESGSDSSGSGSAGGVPPGLKADVTVCKGGGSGCDYETVQEAVDAAPDNNGSCTRFVIWIKTGVYEETVRIPLEKKNVVFLGDGMGKTVISGSMNAGQQGMSTYNSATVGKFAAFSCYLIFSIGFIFIIIILIVVAQREILD